MSECGGEKKHESNSMEQHGEQGAKDRVGAGDHSTAKVGTINDREFMSFLWPMDPPQGLTWRRGRSQMSHDSVLGM